MKIDKEIPNLFRYIIIQLDTNKSDFLDKNGKLIFSRVFKNLK